MAYASGMKMSGLTGIIGGGIGAYIGYTQAANVSDLEPLAGALILGGVGFVLGSAGAFILKSAMQFVIYVIMLALLAYFFQFQIEDMTGVNPVGATLSFLDSVGIPVGDLEKYKKVRP